MRYLQILILLLLPAVVQSQAREANIMISGHAANGRQLEIGKSSSLGGASIQIDNDNIAFGVSALFGKGQGSTLSLLRVGMAGYFVRMPFVRGSRRYIPQLGFYYDAVIPWGKAKANPQMFGGASFRTLMLGRNAGARDIYFSLDIRIGTAFRKSGMYVPTSFLDQQVLFSAHFPLLWN